jgi:hypothetical protein
MRRSDSKAALGRLRADLRRRRGAKGKARVGDDTGSAAGRAAERAKVHRMQEHAREERRLKQPYVAIVADLLANAARLVGTLVSLPFRVARAMRGHRTRDVTA